MWMPLQFVFSSLYFLDRSCTPVKNEGVSGVSFGSFSCDALCDYCGVAVGIHGTLILLFKSLHQRPLIRFGSLVCQEASGS